MTTGDAVLPLTLPTFGNRSRERGWPAATRWASPSTSFALFGLWRLLGLRNTEPRATGAVRAVIAGELSLQIADE